MAAKVPIYKALQPERLLLVWIYVGVNVGGVFANRFMEQYCSSHAA